MEQDHIELVGAVAPALVPVAKTVTQNRMQRKRMETRKEHDLEIVEAKQESQHTGTSTPPMPDPSPDRGHADDDAWENSLDRLKSGEECDMCRTLIEGMRDLPPEDRATALTEFGRFKQAVDDTDDVAEVREVVGSLPLLKRIMEDEFGMVA